ncbi:MAG: thioesterase domain-containing protein [Leptolyngbyaceae cyanobacterium]
MLIDCAEIEQYLHEHIPMSQAMAVAVEAIAETGVTLSAPLAPNINHRHTAFGGSISTLAILSAWTAVHVGLLREQIPCRIVIQRNSVDYLGPIEGDFQARCLPPTPQAWGKFLRAIARHGKGRINLVAEVTAGGEVAGRFQGDYVALKIAGDGR